MNINISSSQTLAINLIHYGPCRGYSRMVGAKKTPLPSPTSIKSVTHINNDETWQSYTLPKEVPKNI